MGKLDIFGDVTRIGPTPWRARPIVVFEPVGFFRRLTLDILRFAGAEKLLPTACPADTLARLSESREAILVAGWHDRGADGLSLVRRLRTTPGPAQQAEAILLSPPRRALDIEDARDAGASGYLLRPFSAKTIDSRIGEITLRRPRFIRTSRFTGPDRRKPRARHLSQPQGFKRGADVEAGCVTAIEAALKITRTMNRFCVRVEPGSTEEEGTDRAQCMRRRALVGPQCGLIVVPGAIRDSLT